MISLEDYAQWLKSHGYSDRTPNGGPSTVQDYAGRVRRVAESERLNIQNFAKKINIMVWDYSPDGCKASEGMKSHHAVYSALKLFQEYVNDQK